MTTLHTIHTARLNNNCPTCYKNDGLEFTFTQKKTENKFFESADKEVNSSLYCHSCNQDIFPVNWTEDIERVHEYHYKMAHPLATNTKLKPFAYVILLVSIVVVGAIMYSLFAL